MGLGKPSLALKDPTHQLGRSGEGPSYKETKEREAGRVTDGAVLPMKFWKQNRGKGPC
jgi:hypothetical protein